MISANAGQQVDQLVAILLDQNVDVNNVPNNDNHNGKIKIYMHLSFSNNYLEFVIWNFLVYFYCNGEINKKKL